MLLHAILNGLPRRSDCFRTEPESSEEDEVIVKRSRKEEIEAMKPEIKKHLRSLLDDKLRSSGVDPVSYSIDIHLLVLYDVHGINY